MTEGQPVWDLDRLNLEQALRDAEVANARVIDLTARLLDAQDQIARMKARPYEQVRGQLQLLGEYQQRIAELEAHLARYESDGP